MAAAFLTTAALEIYLVWPSSPLGQFIGNAPTHERWVSPLSHAILKDALHASQIEVNARKRALRLVEQHRQSMRQHGPQYPYPDAEAIRIWSEVRGLEVDIPPYDDGIAKHPAQKLGPDELLVFATAAAFSKPLVGPMPADEATIEFLSDMGVRFLSVIGIRR
jgi:hypothetical protein